MSEVPTGGVEPFSPEAFARLRAHTQFRSAVEALARQNLANYGGATLAERWLTSDLGRAALTGAVMALDGIQGRFTAAQLIAAARRNRTCSDGRVRHYLQRAAANGFLEPEVDGVWRVSTRLMTVLAGGVRTLLTAVAQLDPGVSAAVERSTDLAFRRRLALNMGLYTVARPDLFAGPDRPILLFLGRDGGTRMLEQIIAAQPEARARLIETAPFSQRSLAKGAFVSRIHVARMLAEGEAAGLLRAEGRRLTLTPALSDDVARHYALVLEMGRASALAALSTEATATGAMADA